MELIKEVISHAHDTFVKNIFSDSKFAVEFFSIHLPADIKEIIDFEYLTLQPNSYINEICKESIVDILFETKIANRKAFLYLLIEHQSTPDKMMPFRIFKYTCNVMDAYLKRHKEKCLPLVYPIVFYHAQKVYPYTTDIRDLINAPRELIDQYFLKPFHLIDLGQIEDEELKNHQAVGLMEFALKHIYARNILTHLQKIPELFQQTIFAGRDKYVEKVLQYIFANGHIEDAEAFFELIKNNISMKLGETTMNAFQRAVQESLMKGKAEGKAEGMIVERKKIIEYMRLTGYSSSVIDEITNLPIIDNETI